ncbi:CoA transferase [Phenylobacterium sp.]|uniref:CaiB/BaiF CoA transferase family protein n=1 Tax=Phenylobacterium sp. TaxID=1871053 RepID=UPI00301CF940
MGPLDGIRVIDMTSVLMGPFATQFLGDMGADVVKIEAPDGDVTRQIAPFRSAGMGAVYMNANRNKRSVCLDLKNPAGHGVLLRLLKDADILVYNVRPRAMARLGLAYEAVSAANPRLIYAGLYGFGQDGPYAAKPAYDDLIQGGSGLSSLFARAGDGVPRYAPSAISDRIVGLTALGAICASLVHRQRTGLGQRVDVPMFETMVNFVLGDHLGGLSYEPPLDRGGYARQLSRDRRPYQTSDGYVCALVYNDKQWRSFLGAIGRAELMDDPRFATFAARAENIDHVYGELARIFLERSTADWLDLLEAADIPSMPMHDLDSLLEDPHLTATGFFQRIEHPSEGAMRVMRPTMRWSQTPAEVRRLAPRQGEHGREVLLEAGFTESEVRAMAEAGALILPDTSGA